MPRECSARVGDDEGGCVCRMSDTKAELWSLSLGDVNLQKIRKGFTIN